MKYTGDYNTRCPLCDSPLTVGAHPVVVRLNGEVSFGKRVCRKCFQPWYAKHTSLKTEKSILEFEDWLNTQLHETVFGCPNSYEIHGFWFGVYENGPLGLVVNYATLS
jgi:hypothetical protein